MFKHTLPAGKYFIGDICYGMDHTIYNNSWCVEHNFEDGMFKCKNNYYVVHSTKFGDGYYPSSTHDASGDAAKYGKYYYVDAGNIGIVHKSMMASGKKDCLNNLGSIHNFTGEVTFEYNDNGTFIIRCEQDDFALEIYTGECPLSENLSGDDYDDADANCSSISDD